MISSAIWNEWAPVNFSKDQKISKIARAHRASEICGLWKNLQVLIYFKLHEKSHVIMC